MVVKVYGNLGYLIFGGLIIFNFILLAYYLIYLNKYSETTKQNLIQEILPVFVPSFRGVSNGSEKAKGTFNEFGVENVTNVSNNFVTTVRNKMFTSVSSSATVETGFTKINQTRNIMRRKSGENSIHVPNSSINNGSIGSIENSSVYFLLPNNSNLITSSDSLLTYFNNFSSFYQNLGSQNRPNFPLPSANTPQKIFLYKTLFSPYIYEPNILMAFTRRMFDFVTNIMRPFSMT